MLRSQSLHQQALNFRLLCGFRASEASARSSAPCLANLINGQCLQLFPLVYKYMFAVLHTGHKGTPCNCNSRIFSVAYATDELCMAWR